MATINITVQSLLNTAVYDSYAVDNAGTIGELKASIEATTNCSVDWFDLVFNESVLATAQTIGSYGIVEGNVLSPFISVQQYTTSSDLFRTNDLQYVDISFSPQDKIDIFTSASIVANNPTTWHYSTWVKPL